MEILFKEGRKYKYHSCQNCPQLIRYHNKRCKKCYWESMRIPLKIRFWKHVDKNSPNGCWEWTGSIFKGGYGQCERRNAHRISWILEYGEIQEGLMVCHKCDNRRCVNTSHLFLGTHKDNMVDRSNKNRQASKERHGCHKLSIEQVNFIRSCNLKTNILSKTYDVNPSTINRIKNGSHWK